ncbi:MAG: ABC transporter substrate-binding protein [Gammaproteobacteria bacterium]|nr:ABC transporter substrate-binding protein [Gammaproteobacteria bacterium]
MKRQNAASRRVAGSARARGLLALLAAVLAGGCTDSPWNNPYPAAERAADIYYDAFSERPKHLDPASSYSENEAVFVSQIYEPPLQYHYLAKPYRLEPLTATAIPEPVFLDAAGHELAPGTPVRDVAYSRYRIRIRPGIRFQPHPAFARAPDGSLRYQAMDAAALAGVHVLADFPGTGTRELEAADYVYQVKRLAHPRIHSPIAGLMGEYVVGLAALGARLAAQTGGDAPPVWLDLREYELEGARVVDRYTYDITVKGVYPQFVYWLAMNFFAPMPWEADRFYAQPGMAERNITLDWFPVGTGPYVLTENNPNRRMVMVRNPNYHFDQYPTGGGPDAAGAGLLRDAGKPVPFIDEAHYSLERESIPEWNKFLQGYYDTATITSDAFDQAVRIGAGGGHELTDEMRAHEIRMLSAVAPTVSYMGFNMTDSVVGGDGERARLLRRAISIAVDYEEFVSIFLNGRGVAAQGPLPPGIFGYREGEAGINPYVYEWHDGRARRRPLAEARRLIAEAGYPNGVDRRSGRPLVLNFDAVASGPDSKAMFDWLRKQFSKLGVQLVVRATDYNRFQDKMRKGTAQIYQWGWNADYPDPENFLFLLYGPNAKVAAGGENASNYAEPRFDHLFERMMLSPNGPARQAVIDEMVDIARRDAPWVWGYYPVGFVLYHHWYANAYPNLMARNTLKYKRIDAALRARRRAEWNRPVVWPVVVAVSALVLSVVPAWWTFRRRERAAAL